MYELLIGEISKNRTSKWDNGSKNPYEVLKQTMYRGECTMGTLQEAAQCFHDELQIDWGAFAWKASKADLMRFFRRKGYPLDALDPFSDYKLYGVVYIDQ